VSDQPEDKAARNSSATDRTGEFFAVGAPLHAVKASYIRRRADDLLYEAAVAGRYAHVIAPDRSGKSSLVAATAARLENHGVRVAVLDLNQIGVRDGAQDAGRWYYNVAYRLLRQLRIRFDLQEWWQDKSMLGNRQRLFEFYAEVLLQNVSDDIVVFVDEMQCVEEVAHADQLLASIRAAHNARATDPDFLRLTFVLLGECDPLVLVNEPEVSPFNVTQAIPLDDFSRGDLDRFAPEFQVPRDRAEEALDRIFHWTRGQPYLSQKLARAVSRDLGDGDVAEQVDRIAAQQLAGKAALHNEPHMSHIHRQVMSTGKQREALLNLYGRIRKGITVSADLGSAAQRRLLATGLVEVDEAGDLRVRNRAYGAVFTARWANDNLRIRWQAPLAVASILLVAVLVPLWYTQWLPSPYAATLASPATNLVDAETAWRNLRSFPGHTAKADRLLEAYLAEAARRAESAGVMASIASLATEMPSGEGLGLRLSAEFWDRRVREALRVEDRDAALLASLEALMLSTPERRHRAAMLVGNDYPLLNATIPTGTGQVSFDPANLLLTAHNGVQVRQWTLDRDVPVRRDDWTMTALEVTPLVRRVVVDREGTTQRIGLTLNISHPRLRDLRIRLIAPSGRAVEISLDRDRSSSNDDLRVPATQLESLVGEPLSGTWTLSLRDEATGVAGHLVGWNLSLNSQGLVESFQRGMSIPDPVEQPTEQFRISDDGRYAVARAALSDSARVWDLLVAKPVASLPVAANERLVGLSAGARRLVTASAESVTLWDVATGRRVGGLPVVDSGGAVELTRDGRHLFVQRRGDVDTTFELWNLESTTRTASLVVAGSAGQVAIDSTGNRIAVADYDRAVRIWDLASGQQVAQVDLPGQPTALRMNASGQVVGAVLGGRGVAAWSVEHPQVPLVERFGPGRWDLVFSPTGSRLAAGKAQAGYELFDADSGRLLGPALGMLGEVPATAANLPRFGSRDATLVTRGAGGSVRYWQVPAATGAAEAPAMEHRTWSPAEDLPVVALPSARELVMSDRDGHVHFTGLSDDATAIADGDPLGFVGHSGPVRLLVASADGARVASVGVDNTVRIWSADDGSPARFIANVSGGPIIGAAFSPDRARLAVLSPGRLTILDSATGRFLAEIDLPENGTSLVFADGQTLYVGTESGRLGAASPDANGRWSLQHVWQSAAGIVHLAVAPQGRSLVVVDEARAATRFDLATSQPGPDVLVLPAPVEEVVFSPSGSRVLFRTARWVHQASAAAGGLAWLDAVLVPRPLAGGRIVFGDPKKRDAANGDAFYLPVARDGAATLARFGFLHGSGTRLLGNREALTELWRRRLGSVPVDAGVAAAP